MILRGESELTCPFPHRFLKNRESNSLFPSFSPLSPEGVQEAFLRLSLALISLSKSAPNCGLITKDYDSRRKSEDFLSFPPSLLLLREKIREEEEEEREGKRVSALAKCC